MHICLRYFGALALCLLAGCSPRYDTHYTLTPPCSAQGQNCISQCLTTLHHCETACNKTRAVCQARMGSPLDISYQSVVVQRNGVPTVKTVQKYTPNSSYSAFSCEDSGCRSICLQSMHDCYQHCGGKVETSEKCIAHCPGGMPWSNMKIPSARSAPPSRCMP